MSRTLYGCATCSRSPISYSNTVVSCLHRQGFICHSNPPSISMHVLSCSCSWHRSISKMTKIGPRICLQVSYHKFCGNAHEQTDACDLPATSFTGDNHRAMGYTVLSRWIHACNWSNYCDYNVRNSSFNCPRNRNSEVSQSETHLNFDASIDADA